jgi:SH3-like domain-containing protein
MNMIKRGGFEMRRHIAWLVLAACTIAIPSAVAQRQPPYWASIHSGEALMRTGPGRNYPATWLYIRPDLPIKVVGVMGDWRRIEDPDGTVGWMLVSLLSDQRSGIVRGADAQPMHESANEGAPVRFRAEPGVVGRVSDCEDNWCLFEVGQRSGYIRTEVIWGVESGEAID